MILVGKMKRVEEDFLGKKEVPESSYYGIFTVRANETFKLSSQKVDLRIIYAGAMIKKAAALANKDVGRLEKEKADAIVKACDEVFLRNKLIPFSFKFNNFIAYRFCAIPRAVQ